MKYLESSAIRWESELNAPRIGGWSLRSEDPKYLNAVVAALIDRCDVRLHLTRGRLLHESGAFRRHTFDHGVDRYIPITPTVEKLLWVICGKAEGELAKAVERCVGTLVPIGYFHVLSRFRNPTTGADKGNMWERVCKLSIVKHMLGGEVSAELAPFQSVTLFLCIYLCSFTYTEGVHYEESMAC